jgi:hypothetical protein
MLIPQGAGPNVPVSPLHLHEPSVDRWKAPLPYRPCAKSQQGGSQSRPKIVLEQRETAYPSINLLNIAAIK